MDTYGTRAPWSSSSGEDEPPGSPAPASSPASGYLQGRPEGDQVAADGGPATTAPAADDVVVVESVHTGDQGIADYGMAEADTEADTGAPTSAAGGTTTSAGDRTAEWSEIKALFVDDPSASVRRASSLVEQAVEEFMSALRQRQDSLSAWHEGDATATEDLRKALRGYRGLFDQLEQVSAQFPSGSAGQA